MTTTQTGTTQTGEAEVRMASDAQAMMGVGAFFPVGPALWFTHRALADVWPSMASVEIWPWTKWTVLNSSNVALLDSGWRDLLESGYATYLLALAAVGMLVWTLAFAALTRRPIGRSLIHAILGLTVGAALGFGAPWVIELPPLWGVLAVPLGALVFAVPFVLSVDTATSSTHRRGAIVAAGPALKAEGRRKPAKRKPAGAAAPERMPARSPARLPGLFSRSRHQPVLLAGQELSFDAETRHVLLIGQTGSGKSVTLRDLLSDAFARGDRAVVADPDGSSMSAFFEEGDVIINPLDRRGRPWDLMGELSDEASYRQIAAALIPYMPGSNNDSWVDDGRTVLTAVLRSWKSLELGSMSSLAKLLGSQDIQRLAELVEGSAAARFFAEGNERMLGSVLARLTVASEMIGLLAKGTGEPVSIRRWVHEGQGRLWLPYRTDQVQTLKSAYACLLSIAMIETLSLPPNETRRLWFAIDETDHLGRITDLELLLTKGRKYGACAVLGLQSIAQLEAHYGQALASVIAEQCGNSLILRCGLSDHGGTAQFASRLIGDREVAVPEETTSTSKGPNGSVSVTRSTRRHVEAAVLPSEIAQLPDREGFLKLSSKPEWRRVAFDVTRYAPVAPPFEPREA